VLGLAEKEEGAAPGYESDLSETSQAVIASGEKKILGRMPAKDRSPPAVERLLEGLDERDRLMLILKEVEGFSIDEIAEVLSLNGNTVEG